VTRPSIEICCQKLSSGVATGAILVSADDICFYLTEPETGILRDRGHALDGQSLAGKVLVFPGGKGSAVVQDEGLFGLKEHDNMPLALIIKNPDTVLIFGSLLLKLPVVNQVEPAMYKYLVDGVNVKIDADHGIITVLNS
jgi:predicted aconitase with swiveling domain